MSGAENGAERPENRVERSGAVSGPAWEKNGGAERSAEREVAERERSVDRGADPGGAGGAAAPPILILVVQTYHFAPPIIPVHK